MERCDGVPQAAPDAVPHHRGPDSPAHGVPDADVVEGAGVTPLVQGTRADRDGPTSPVPTGVREQLELPPIPDRSDQALSLWRPLSRRERSTLRPARSDMRCRKPCFLARRRLLGWNVRFTVDLLQRARDTGTSSNGPTDGPGRGASADGGPGGDRDENRRRHSAGSVGADRHGRQLRSPPARLNPSGGVLGFAARIGEPRRRSTEHAHRRRVARPSTFSTAVDSVVDGGRVGRS